MKKLIYLILTFSPLLTVAKVPEEMVEKKYISVLARSFNSDNLNPPRTTLYWSLCLGETRALSKVDISDRIMSLLTDSTKLHTFYRRLNFYRRYKDAPGSSVESYDKVLLPYETNPKKQRGGELKIQVLSFDKPDITESDWITYTDYVTSYGDDPVLTARWMLYANTTPNNSDSSKIAVKTETMPTFPGGDGALLSFLQHQIHYPQLERDNDISGKVLCRFVICPDGHISAGTIVRKVSPGLDRESMLMLKMLPNFIPGTQDGKPVPVYFNLPIVFRLQ